MTPDEQSELLGELESLQWQIWQVSATLSGLVQAVGAIQARIRKPSGGAVIPILQAERRWECPSCDYTDVTHEAQPHTRMHACRGLRGLTAPMVPAGTRAEHRTHEREDYIGSDLVQTDGEGRPVMSVTTIRDDGEDCTVYAPTATGRGAA